MNKKRIILCGKAASGKDFIKSKFREKGFVIDVSYTSRPPREGEVNGIDYVFMTKEGFEAMIKVDGFYEWVKHGDYYYGTGAYEWNESDVFIMESDGVSHIKCEDRVNSLVIYVTVPEVVRTQRLLDRGWDMKKINERMNLDDKKFKDFKDFDLVINSIDNLKL